MLRKNRLYVLKESLNASLSAFAASGAEYGEEDEELLPLEADPPPAKSVRLGMVLHHLEF